MGQIVHVQGIDIELPEQPQDHEIGNYQLKKKDQKWIRPVLPSFSVRDIDIWEGDFAPDDEIPWEEAVRQETIKITGCDPLDLDRSGNPKIVPGIIADPDYCSEAVDNYRKQELDRIKNGYWIFVNGKAYYLPGTYYFYLAYWWCGDCYPEFRYPDLELMWLFHHVYHSKIWLGIIYITMRSTGKSYLSGCMDYWVSITKREARTGVQSKTDDDAADFFREKVLIPVTKLPEFLRGIHKDMFLGDITGASSIDFSPPARKKMSMKLYNRMKKEALYGLSDFKAAGEKAYDGQSLSFYVGDEIGKTEPSIADVYERWNVVFNCVWRGNKKRGTALLTSTVSKLSEGGAECKRIYDNSDPGKINENGRTSTGLVRYFRSAVDATYFDEYGFPDREKSKAYHDAERASRAHDSQALITYKQQNPYNDTEAFWINSEKCVYNAEILLNAKDRIINGDRVLSRRGDIEWKVKDKEAEWIDNDVNGKWYVSFLNFEQNKVNIRDNKTFEPLMGSKRVMAFDPYANSDIVDENRGSDGAAVVYSKYDFNIPEEFCNTIIADYLYRWDDPFKSYEDIICACFFFGCPVLIEKNKSNALDYFRTRGYKWGRAGNSSDFILERPESTFTQNNTKPSDGITSGTGIIEHYVNSTARHIKDHGWKLKHLRPVEDWLIFNPAKTKKYDMAVAASLAIVAAEKKITEESKPVELSKIFKTYNNTGSRSSQN